MALKNQVNAENKTQDYSLLNKAEVGKKLDYVNKRILDKSSKIDRSLSISLLLCLEDVIESCLIDCVRQIRVGGINVDRKTSMITQKYFVQLVNELNSSIVNYEEQLFC